MYDIDWAQKCPHAKELNRVKLSNLRSVVTDFELVCENSFIDPIISSLFMAGMLFGVTIFGLVAQKLMNALKETRFSNELIYKLKIL